MIEGAAKLTYWLTGCQQLLYQLFMKYKLLVTQ